VIRVVIIGAGVAGLGIGWRLLQAGCQVTILERAQPATGASWAAAGMLAITAELEEATEAERGLALRAHALWPGFAAELEAASGRPVFFSRVGALLLAVLFATPVASQAVNPTARPPMPVPSAGQLEPKLPVPTLPRVPTLRENILPGTSVPSVTPKDRDAIACAAARDAYRNQGCEGSCNEECRP